MIKTKENLNIKNKKSDFTKLTRSGISLIVLVITIIVIVILASAVILSISNNNPVVEANVARYESDCANMQAIFTNTVAKVMAKNKGVVKISYGQINEIVSGQKEVTGQVEYIVVDAENSDNTSGKIIFDKGDNKEVEYYTGKKLPIYAAGDTKWYVDEEGNISLKVKTDEYGNGIIPLDPGLYDKNGEIILTWNELVNNYGIDVQKDYVSVDEIEEFLSSETLPEIIQNGNYPAAKILANSNLTRCTKIVVGNNVTKIGSGAFVFFPTLEEIIIPDGVTSIGDATFAMCSKLKNIELPETLSSIGYLAFGKCYELENIKLPNSLAVLGEEAFWGCTGLKSIEIPNLVEIISREAFCECTNLEKVKIGKSVQSIDNLAFGRCYSIADINIPERVTEINYYAFEECTNLKTIYYKGTAQGAPWGAENAIVESNY